jgi:hypothetical protein
MMRVGLRVKLSVRFMYEEQSTLTYPLLGGAGVP